MKLKAFFILWQFLIVVPLVGCHLLKRTSSSPKIVGGEDVVHWEHPFDAVVAIMYTPYVGADPEVWCTGTLIHPEIVITAKHCLDSEPSPTFVRFCNDGRKACDGDGVIHDFKARDAYFAVGIKRDPDFGYLRLASSVPAQVARPVGLPSKSERAALVQNSREVTLAGFGVTSPNSNTHGIKRRVKSQILSVLGNFTFLGAGNGKDTCQGDSGGPVFAALDDGSIRLVGITSRGPIDCKGFGTYVDARSTACSIQIHSSIALGESVDCPADDSPLQSLRSLKESTASPTPVSTPTFTVISPAATATPGSDPLNGASSSTWHLRFSSTEEYEFLYVAAARQWKDGGSACKAAGEGWELPRHSMIEAALRDGLLDPARNPSFATKVATGAWAWSSYLNSLGTAALAVDLGKGKDAYREVGESLAVFCIRKK